MDEYKLGDFSIMLTAANRARSQLLTGDSLKRSMSSLRSTQAADITITDICSDEFIKNLALVIDGLAISCRNFDCDPALLSQMESFKNDLDQGSGEWREGILAAKLELILIAVEDNLKSRRFMFIPPDQAAYYDDLLMFGPEFLNSFPKAALVEMLEAGRCYACGRWTACIFHGMRVSEYGLRKLFKLVGAKLPVKGTKTPVPKQVRYPIEYGDWNAVLTQIRNKIVKTRALPTGPRKEKRLQFFSDMADHCEYMKDIWRNELSHTRRIYNKPEALGALGRVKSFVTLVASGAPK